MSTGNHQLAQWNSISAAGAAPQAQLITARCRCNYHTLKATIVARSTFSVNTTSMAVVPVGVLSARLRALPSHALFVFNLTCFSQLI